MFQDGYLYGTNGFSAFDFGREVIKAIEEADVDLGQGQAMISGTKSQSACRRVNLAPWLRERLRSRAEQSGTDGLVFASPAHIDQPGKPWEQANSANALAASSGRLASRGPRLIPSRHGIATELHSQAYRWKALLTGSGTQRLPSLLGIWARISAATRPT